MKKINILLQRFVFFSCGESRIPILAAEAIDLFFIAYDLQSGSMPRVSFYFWIWVFLCQTTTQRPIALQNLSRIQPDEMIDMNSLHIHKLIQLRSDGQCE